jgi:hypothetical protein
MMKSHLYQPEPDLTVCAWFERSGFVSEVIRIGLAVHRLNARDALYSRGCSPIGSSGL